MNHYTPTDFASLANSGGYVADPYPSTIPWWAITMLAAIFIGLVTLEWIGRVRTNNRPKPHSTLALISLSTLLTACAGALIGSGFAAAAETRQIRATSEHTIDSEFIPWAKDRYGITIDTKIAFALVYSVPVPFFGSQKEIIWDETGQPASLIEAADGTNYLMIINTNGEPISEIPLHNEPLTGGLQETQRTNRETSNWLEDRYALIINDTNASHLLAGDNVTALAEGGELVAFHLTQTIDGNWYAFRDDTGAEVDEGGMTR